MVTFSVNTTRVKLSPVRSDLDLCLYVHDDETNTTRAAFYCKGELAEYIEAERTRIHAQKGKGHSPESNGEEFDRFAYGLMLAYNQGENDEANKLPPLDPSEVLSE